MGCSSNRSISKFSQEEAILHSFELKLNYNNSSVSLIDRIFHRYSTDLNTTQTQLAKAFSELGLVHSEFYNYFLTKKGFQTKKLCTLGVLLGNSKYSEKLKTLFLNYDVELSGQLSREQLKEMIEDVTEIACVFVPRYAAGLDSENVRLEEYREILTEASKSIVSEIVNCLLNGKKGIYEHEFLTRFRLGEDVGCFIEVGRLRKYCVEAWFDIMKPMKEALKSIEKQKVSKLNSLSERRIRKKGIFNSSYMRNESL